MLIRISPLAILIGVLLGCSTLFIALLSPAKKASIISPVSALSGNTEKVSGKKKKKGYLAKILPIEVVMGIKNAFKVKKTLLLMSGSVGLSIILFLLFQSLINPDILGMRPIQKYTADFRISSSTGIDDNIFKELKKMDSLKNVNGRMNTFINASVKMEDLTDRYIEKSGVQLAANEEGYVTDPEKSWLISYDKEQFKWAKSYLSEGTSDEEYLNKNRGIIAVNKISRDELYLKKTQFKIGDKVKIDTLSGPMEFTIVGIIDSLPYATSELTMTSFVTTEELYRKISMDAQYKDIDIQIFKNTPETILTKLNQFASETVNVGDHRQLNAKTNNAYMTVAVFIYGFVGVIAIISIINIINTMNASVISKTRRLGVMRAVGLTGGQLVRMILTESTVFCLCGCGVGLIFGLFLRHILMDFFLLDYHFPILHVILIVLSCLIASTIAVINPIKRITSQRVAEIISGQITQK